MFFYDIFDNLTLSVEGNVRSLESASVRLGANMDAVEVSNGFSIEGTDGLGAGIFHKYEIVSLNGPSTQITTFGLELPMKICVSDCNNETNAEIIYLEGTIFSELIVGTTLPPATTIGGQLSMIGTWSEPFGLPILHISDVVAGAAFDLKLGFPAPPTSLILGASICLGSSDACSDPKDYNRKDFIDAAAYIGLNANVPEKNFFFAMVSILRIWCDLWACIILCLSVFLTDSQFSCFLDIFIYY